MKEKFEKAKNWIKEHKDDIAAATYYGVLFVGGGILVHKCVKALKSGPAFTELPVPENWDAGKVAWVAQDKAGDCAVFVADIPADKLTGIGEALRDTLAPKEFKYANIFVTFLNEEVKVD